jgi:hypothetical protein
LKYSLLRLLVCLAYPLWGWGNGPLPAQTLLAGPNPARPVLQWAVPRVVLPALPDRPFTRWQLAETRWQFSRLQQQPAATPRVWHGRLKLQLTAADSARLPQGHISPGVARWVAENREEEFRIRMGTAWEIKQGAFWFQRHWTISFAQMSTQPTVSLDHFKLPTRQTQAAPQAPLAPRLNRNGRVRRPLFNPESGAGQFLQQWRAQLAQPAYWLNWLQDQRPGVQLGYWF